VLIHFVHVQICSLFSVLYNIGLPGLTAFISTVHCAVFFNMHVEVSTLY